MAYKNCPNCRKDISSENIKEMYFSGCPFCKRYIISKNMLRAAIDKETVTPREFFGPIFTEEQKKELAKIKAKANEYRERMKYD